MCWVVESVLWSIVPLLLFYSFVYVYFVMSIHSSLNPECEVCPTLAHEIKINKHLRFTTSWPLTYIYQAAWEIINNGDAKIHKGKAESGRGRGRSRHWPLCSTFCQSGKKGVIVDDLSPSLTQCRFVSQSGSLLIKESVRLQYDRPFFCLGINEWLLSIHSV